MEKAKQVLQKTVLNISYKNHNIIQMKLKKLQIMHTIQSQFQAAATESTTCLRFTSKACFELLTI